MAYYADLEFDNELEIDLDIDDLAFLGITDHSKMTNRDATEQHPIEAITGLDGVLSRHAEALTDHGNAIADIGETLTDHAAAILANTDDLNDHGEELEDHSSRIEALELAATDNEIEEVWDNGN